MPLTRRRRIAAAVLVAALAMTACSKETSEGSSVAPSAPVAESPSESEPTGSSVPTDALRSAPEPLATATDTNLAAADMGGAVELLTGNYDELQTNYGPGLTGHRLIDGLAEPAWMTPADWSPNRMFNPAWGWAAYPVDVVLSFYERMSALVGAVTIVVPDAVSVELQDDTSTAPREVEVWTSMDNVPAHFEKIAAAAIDPTPGEHAIPTPAREARFVRLRVVSGASQRVLEIGEVRVLEAVRDGYVPLFTRAPDVAHWNGSPRQAAQRGLDWLQQSAVDWNEGSQECMGCHVQSQALMGQWVALQNHYRVSMPALAKLTDRIRSQETPTGTWIGGSEVTSSVFGAMGLAFAANAMQRSNDPALMRAADFVLASLDVDGAIPEPNQEPPILQGEFVMAANALVAFEWAAAHSPDPKYAQAGERFIRWISSHEPESTQDKAFQVVALMHYGTAEEKRVAWSTAEALASEQQPDGGWKEAAVTDGSNAFATGQVLYAFKQAGVSVSAPHFRRGTAFLLRTQINDTSPAKGSWKAVHTQSQRKSDFAPTMWAVIGLAGAYGAEPLGALAVTKQGSDSNARRNLEIVLDASGSMKEALGESTRWDTALAVLKEVVGTLPENLNVGLRIYGHRFSSTSAQTCNDTELVVPITKLDQNRLVETASKYKPRGETPLVRSIEQTAADLKVAGGGSVILITDGEESCHGDPRAAAAKLKASGVNVRLNIVGFAVTGKEVEAELRALAESADGRYYSAQDGSQLARALKLTAMLRLPYDVIDDAGRTLMSAETSELSRELLPGNYRVRVAALDQTLEEPVTIVANETTKLDVEVAGDRLYFRH